MQSSDQKRPAKKELWFQCGRYFARTVRREDASERWAQWLGDPWVVEALNLAPRTLTKDDIAGYIKQSDQRTHLMLGIFERGTRVHVGIIRIDLDYATGEALVNAIIGEPEHRNRGATTDAFVSTLDFLFDKEGMARVRASVLDRNQLTLHYLLKMGWELDEPAAGEIKSSADGSMLVVKSVVWTRESYRAFRLTRLGKRGPVCIAWATPSGIREGLAAFWAAYRRGAGGLGGCRSTTTESGCETIVMNQIKLTTSDQNVFQ